MLSDEFKPCVVGCVGSETPPEGAADAGAQLYAPWRSWSRGPWLREEARPGIVEAGGMPLMETSDIVVSEEVWKDLWRFAVGEGSRAKVVCVVIEGMGRMWKMMFGVFVYCRWQGECPGIWGDASRRKGCTR